MRLLITFLIALLLSAPIVYPATLCPGDEPDFPYQAIVLAERASVHSGPGNVHYATNQLAQGSTVEVYRHDPGGWCAIRPPQGSFSLVPESALELISEDVGRVLEDDVRTWVGTSMGAVDQPLWQVKLKRGEEVEVVGEVGWPDPAGHSTLWYQIAPPAGEFRWIRMSDLQLPDPSLRLPDQQVNEQQVNDQSAMQEYRAQERFASNERFENQIAAPRPPQSQSAQNAPVQNNNPGQYNNVIQAGGGQPQTTDGRQYESQVQTVSGAEDIAGSPQPPRANRQNVFVAEATRNYEARRNQPDRNSSSNEQSMSGFPEIAGPAVVNSGWRRSTRSTSPGRHNSVPSQSIPDSFTAPALPGGGSSDAGVYTGSNSIHGGNVAQAEYIASREDSLPTFSNDRNRLDESRTQNESQSQRTFSDTRRNPVDLAEVSTGPVGNALQQIDFQLSKAMLETPDAWQLEPIRDEVDRLHTQSVSMGDRAYAERLQDKLRNCIYLRDEYRRQSGGSSSGPIGTGAVSTSARSASNSPREVLLGTTYDAHGWLSELYSDGGRSQSTFVLKDATGKITHHVAPVAGLNLRIYLNKEIGVNGQRGYNRRLKLDHVTVQTVVELAKLR